MVDHHAPGCGLSHERSVGGETGGSAAWLRTSGGRDSYHQAKMLEIEKLFQEHFDVEKLVDAFGIRP